jgi:hypothetical protein
VKGVQPPGRDHPIDRAARDPRRQELPARDHTVLPGRDLGDDGRPPRRRNDFATHTVVNSLHPSIVAPLSQSNNA